MEKALYVVLKSKYEYVVCCVHIKLLVILWRKDTYEIDLKPGWKAGKRCCLCHLTALSISRPCHSSTRRSDYIYIIVLLKCTPMACYTMLAFHRCKLVVIHSASLWILQLSVLSQANSQLALCHLLICQCHCFHVNVVFIIINSIFVPEGIGSQRNK